MNPSQTVAISGRSPPQPAPQRPRQSDREAAGAGGDGSDGGHGGGIARAAASVNVSRFVAPAIIVEKIGEKQETCRPSGVFNWHTLSGRLKPGAPACDGGIKQESRVGFGWPIVLQHESHLAARADSCVMRMRDAIDDRRVMSMAALFAYFDPGSGSMLLQAIVGGTAGLLVFSKYIWESLRLCAGKRKHDAESRAKCPRSTFG